MGTLEWMTRDPNGEEILSRAECLGLLASRRVGGVALTRNALPTILPVTYRLLGEAVVFTTGIGSTYLAVPRDTVIAFEVDDVDPVSHSGWSVLAVGIACQIDEGEPDWSAAMALDLHPWDGHAMHLIRLSTDHLSGRRLMNHLSSSEGWSAAAVGP